MSMKKKAVFLWFVVYVPEFLLARNSGGLSLLNKTIKYAVPQSQTIPLVVFNDPGIGRFGLTILNCS